MNEDQLKIIIDLHNRKLSEAQLNLSLEQSKVVILEQENEQLRERVKELEADNVQTPKAPIVVDSSDK